MAIGKGSDCANCIIDNLLNDCKLSFMRLLRQNIYNLQALLPRAMSTLVVMWLACGMASADESSDSTAHRLSEVEVIGRSATNKVASTSMVQVMDKEQIRNLGLRNMSDAVRRFAGTNVKDYGGIGGLKTVSVRSLGAAHTAVSYDGVAVSNCQAGQIDIGRFSLDNVQSLSLSIGHDDDLLQPARMYASAGVLNIRTERPTFDMGKNYRAQVQLRGGSFGQVSPALRYSHRLGEGTSLVADASYIRADGNYPFKLSNGLQTTTEKRNNSDIYSWQGEANVFHRFGNGGELSAKAYYFYSERGLPGAVILYNSISKERLWDENFFAQAAYKQAFSDKISFQAQGKYNYSWSRYKDTNVKYENGEQIEVNRQKEYYLSSALSYTPLSNLTFSLAFDGAINTLGTNLNGSPNPVRYTSLTALNVSYRTEKIKLRGTLVGTYITETVKSGTTPDDRKRLSPTISLSYRPYADSEFYLRAMCKSTFRVPTFNDLYYLRVGNINLRAEKATEYTAGVAWSCRPASWLNDLTLTLDGYVNEVDDKIVAFPSTYVWKMQNYGKVRITGLEATLSVSVPLSAGYRMLLSGNYSWQRAIDLSDPSAKNYRDQIPYTPEHSGNASASIETPWLNIGYTLTAVGHRYFMAQNIEANKIAGYAEHTATLWREFKMKKLALRLQAEIINFTDAQYDIIKYYPMPGRSWRLTATFRF